MKTETQNAVRHTQGKWTACPCDGRQIFRIECSGRGNDLQPIATLDGPDMEGNARLIAAAPDLLESCKALQAMHDDAVFVCGADDEPMVNAALSALRAAIDRAEGRSA